MISIATNTFKMMGEALQKVRGQVDILRNEIKQIIVKLYEKILRIIIPIQQLLITIIDLMGKLNGIFQTTIGQAEGAYNIMASSIGALHEFIVIILLALSALVIILWMIPITWGLAAGMTAIFILIMIPLIVIAVYMKAIFKLQGSGIPGVPSCFDENTKFIVHNAIIDEGSSGGPLFDKNGYLIGLNTLKHGNMYYSVSSDHIQEMMK